MRFNSKILDFLLFDLMFFLNSRSTDLHDVTTKRYSPAYSVTFHYDFNTALLKKSYDSLYFSQCSYYRNAPSWSSKAAAFAFTIAVLEDYIDREAHNMPYKGTGDILSRKSEFRKKLVRRLVEHCWVIDEKLYDSSWKSAYEKLDSEDKPEYLNDWYTKITTYDF